jgi:hypothetical protein
MDAILAKYPDFRHKEKKLTSMCKCDENTLWNKVKEYDSSADESDEEEYSKWWKFDDENMYFMMATKYKNIYLKHQQLFHCYGRRTNRFLLLNYGFCLRYNKYNSVNFRVFFDKHGE